MQLHTMQLMCIHSGHASRQQAKKDIDRQLVVQCCSAAAKITQWDIFLLHALVK